MDLFFVNFKALVWKPGPWNHSICTIVRETGNIYKTIQKTHKIESMLQISAKEGTEHDIIDEE